MKNSINNLFQNILTLRNKLERKFTGKISSKTHCTKRGNVLISYITAPFVLNQNSPSFNNHSSYWECKEMVRIFNSFGYDVDIIDWKNNEFVPTKKYSFFVDLGLNMERLSRILNPECVKIAHLTESHWLFANRAELERIENLKNRKGVVLLPHRNVKPHKGIEIADFVSMLGNKKTAETYSYANRPINSIPLSSGFVVSFPSRDVEKSRKNFLWLGGGGAVHKGLDLVLEAFSQMPEFNLIVCGPFKAEQDFVKIYHKELYETPNIKAVGFVNIKSRQFLDIVNNCIGLIYPSCSEGQAGSVITCMNAGLIPIISRQSGVDVDSFGTILKDNSIDAIKKSIRDLASLPSEELMERTKKSWEYANKHHTRNQFTQEYIKFIKKIIK